jgi:hypothetical protein
MLNSAVLNVSIYLFDGKYGGMRPLLRGVIDLPLIGHEQIKWDQNVSDCSPQLIPYKKLFDIFADNTVSTNV